MQKFTTSQGEEFNYSELDNSNWQSYFKLPNSGLRAYFSRVESGQPDEYRTPFFDGKPLSSILKGWDSELETISQQWPGLYEFEMDLRKKVGPMSIMKPLNLRIDDIESYYDSILLESKPISQAAKEALVRDWTPRIRGIRLRSLDRTIANMKLSTNSGNPFFMKRKLALKDMGKFTIVTERGYRGEYDYQVFDGREAYKLCAILGWRGQEGGPAWDDVKQRVVWMFPFALNAFELRFYQPFIQAIQKYNLVPAWNSMDHVDAAITKLFDTKDDKDLVICTDFSKFDQHFNHDMQECTKTVLTQLGVDEKWLRDIYPIKYRIPLTFDWKCMKFGHHGMGSGSGGTNADETIAHRCLQYEAALSHNRTLNPYSQCLGDDGILSYPGCTVDEVLDSYTQHGQEMNVDKQSADPLQCTYLRRWHHKDYRIKGVCVGVYSTYRALGRLAEQERYYDPEKWSSKMVALRQLSILENVKYHPLREQFVAYCMKGDKYRLGIDIPGFLDNIESIAKEATEYMPDFLGYTKSLQHNLDSEERVTGIKKWWIVQYLKSQRV